MSSEDKYETLEKIGHGSFGVIRKVRRKTDGFIMCRKEISYLRMSQKEREQLHAEFQILSHLRHDNIVAYYHREHLKASQDLHLYMEYCGNGDLGRVIKDLQLRGQRAQESFVWSIFSQLVLALYRCHYGIDPPEVGTNILGLTQGVASAPKTPAGAMTILHRDLKPENVFLGEDNSVKLGDFGLSKMIKSQDFASTYVGTPFYMSPEICAAEKYTLKSDIWALGCIIFELCAKEPPFNAKTHYQLVQKIKEGKVAPLPDIYSPELNQVIRDCLKVNPDRRPDTVQLLNLPVVRLMRKEKEVVDLNKSFKSREEILRQKERELNDRLVAFEREKQKIREDADASLRLEWEVKARLEIDRLVNAELENLQKKFEGEVKARVDAELAKKAVTFAEKEEEKHIDDYASSVNKSDYPHSSIGPSGDEYPSTTDISEYSMDSPDTSKEAKKPARTPFARAQTMFAGPPGTPMDIEMASPSPIAIASLSLSPRRNGATKPPVAKPGNIFAAAAAATAAGSVDARWELHREPILVDSDDEDICPSPTRHIKSSKNPFKTRPILSSQKSCPVQRAKPAGSNIKAAASQPDLIPRSPSRSPTKIPVANSSDAPAAGPASSAREALSRARSVKKDASAVTSSNSSSGGESLGKMAAKNNLRGRSLVELQQARAGGRPLSAAGSAPGSENVSPKRAAAFRERMAAERREYEDVVAVWDPERDDMPSPFLNRRRNIKV
ncbi:G2-specific protein kinase nimA [Cordyceps fumosorosea ARSEF 2679]|uniref:non-specific serine/threonine protein kinase n=1 Tax=Cordyceps fumosorosea (strain ARSEF 2679) TaxID=1081104 RepID=A0A167TJ13_CORFA|nr:G2-specific protein kinase nimA [Cordyceps fumosorosea ARSEF 2679]OAA60647.1 G2-specific protein kinase nimA [Cordyceps fumosorosea ARSEF 2679]